MRRLFSFIAVTALIFCCAFLSFSSKLTTAYADTEFDYSQDFSDTNSVLQDFNAYYLTKFMGILTFEDNIYTPLAHWEFSDNSAKRLGLVSNAQGADNIAMLTYTKRTFTNFHLKVDVKAGSLTDFWGAICIRQDLPGKMFFEDGTAFYIEREGNVRTWGRAYYGGPFLLERISNYNHSEWITYDMVVSGNIMALTLSTATDTTQITVRMPWSFYRSGYITLMSINNNSEFRNFQVSPLPDTENIGSDQPDEQSIPAVIDPNALDSLLTVDDAEGTVPDWSEIEDASPSTTDNDGCSNAGAIVFFTPLLFLLKRRL